MRLYKKQYEWSIDREHFFRASKNTKSVFSATGGRQRVYPKGRQGQKGRQAANGQIRINSPGSQQENSLRVNARKCQQ